MKFLKKIRKEVKVIFLVIVALISIAWAEKRQNKIVCNSIRVKIINPEESNFVDEKEIVKLVSGDRAVPLIGNTYDRINLKEIETRAESNKYIQEAEAFKDHKGDLIVDAYVAVPIARIMRPGKPDMYITEKGELIDTSPKYTSRVLLITGDYVNNFSQSIKKDTTQQKLFDFLEFINNHPFWKAQIAQIDMDKDADLVLYPEVSKQYIQFGSLEDWPAKMFKLKIFYDKILPFKGWNTYSRVNLEYENQIICE